MTLGDTILRPGHLGYLGTARAELRLRTTEATRALLIGGVPFPEPVMMWWNYVARDRDEIAAAHAEWTAGSDRFGHVASTPNRRRGRPGSHELAFVYHRVMSEHIHGMPVRDEVVAPSVRALPHDRHPFDAFCGLVDASEAGQGEGI